jgi:hypothetical protein
MNIINIILEGLKILKPKNILFLLELNDKVYLLFRCDNNEQKWCYAQIMNKKPESEEYLDNLVEKIKIDNIEYYLLFGLQHNKLYVAKKTPLRIIKGKEAFDTNNIETETLKQNFNIYQDIFKTKPIDKIKLTSQDIYLLKQIYKTKNVQPNLFQEHQTNINLGNIAKNGSLHIATQMFGGLSSNVSEISDIDYYNIEYDNIEYDNIEYDNIEYDDINNEPDLKLKEYLDVKFD